MHHQAICNVLDRYRCIAKQMAGVGSLRSSPTILFGVDAIDQWLRTGDHSPRPGGQINEEVMDFLEIGR